MFLNLQLTHQVQDLDLQSLEELRLFIETLLKKQKKAAKMLGVSTSTYSAWAADEKTPSVKNANKLKDMFGVTFDEIFSKNKSAPTSLENNHD